MTHKIRRTNITLTEAHPTYISVHIVIDIDFKNMRTSNGYGSKSSAAMMSPNNGNVITEITTNNSNKCIIISRNSYVTVDLYFIKCCNLSKMFPLWKIEVNRLIFNHSCITHDSKTQYDETWIWHEIFICFKCPCSVPFNPPKSTFFPLSIIWND